MAVYVAALHEWSRGACCRTCGGGVVLLRLRLPDDTVLPADVYCIPDTSLGQPEEMFFTTKTVEVYLEVRQVSSTSIKLRYYSYGFAVCPRRCVGRRLFLLFLHHFVMRAGAIAFSFDLQEQSPHGPLLRIGNGFVGVHVFLRAGYSAGV